jgi:hypothetical protein
MKPRFEMPITPGVDLSGINLFAVDDYLRSIKTAEARRQLIKRVGYSPRKRAAYEKKHGLPRGAVELAMLMEDKRVQEYNRLMTAKLPLLYDRKTDPQVLEDLYKEGFSLTKGLQQLYPEATDFMLQYAVLTQRNRRRFLGDYAFSNEYKLQLVSCFLMCDGGLNCNANINVTVNVNVAVFVNLAAVQKVAVLLAVWLCIAIPVWFYGLPF